MSLAVLTRLENFLTQSRELLLLAQADNWEAFEILLTERQKNLASLGENHFLIEITKAGLAAEAKALIAAIKEVDNQILMSAESSKAEISAKLRQSLQASKAIDAYRG